VVARVLTPGDVFRKMSGPKLWGISLLIGFAGAALSYLIFTVGLGIGDTDVFDFGGIIGAIIGATSFCSLSASSRRQAAPEPASPADHLNRRSARKPSRRSRRHARRAGRGPSHPPR